MSDLLLNEPPVLIQPSLVKRLGMVEAAIVQQLHYWSARAHNVHEGEMYVYKTYQDWSDELGITSKQARGALDRLRAAGVIVGIQNPADSRDRTLWWRIDYAVLHGDDPGSGTRSAPAGSSDLPGKSAGSAPEGSSNAGASGGRTETTSERTAKTGASAPEQVDNFPDELPESLHEVAIAAGKILKRTALTRGQKKSVTRAAVGHAVLTFADRDHVQVAREVEAWLLHGRGASKQCKDVVARYRNFLTNSEPMAGPPLPAGVTPLHGRPRGRNGRSTVADYEALRGKIG